jgi:hypothetical protein
LSSATKVATITLPAGSGVLASPLVIDAAGSNSGLVALVSGQEIVEGNEYFSIVSISYKYYEGSEQVTAALPLERKSSDVTAS